MDTQLQPRVIDRDAEPEYSFLGTPTWFKATGEQTGGAYGLLEHSIAPGNASPWHVHHAEDESFYVVEGTMTFLVGDERFTADPGAYVFGPREIPHGFRNDGAGPARMLLMATPVGFEHFVLTLAEPATPGSSPAGPPDMEKLIALAAQYHIEIIGSLPE